MPLCALASPIASSETNNTKGGTIQTLEVWGAGFPCRQGLVMAPPRARMTDDRSTGVAVKVKLAGIGTETVSKQTYERDT